MIFEFIVLIVSAALVGVALITMLNTLTFHRLEYFRIEERCAGQEDLTQAAANPELYRGPALRVSVLIPARNEADIIEKTVLSLTRQTMPEYDLTLEILVLDDHSIDGTGDVVRSIGDTRVRVLNGKPLPQGWGGKNWACQQLAQAAQGDILIFTDADVQWQENALQAVIYQMEKSQADLLTVWSTQITESWGERLVVPLMALVVMGYLPALAVYRTPFTAFAAANGQCMAFRRKAYEAIGGHEAVKHTIIEDIALARKIKAKGFRLDMADGAGLLTCRMYRGWREVRDGYAKNILAGYGGSLLFLGLATVFHWLLFLMPPLWLALGWLYPTPNYPTAPLLLTTLGLLIRALSAAATKQRLGDALLMPLSVLLMTRIAAQSVYWQVRYGGPQWKGRTVKHYG